MAGAGAADPAAVGAGAGMRAMAGADLEEVADALAQARQTPRAASRAPAWGLTRPGQGAVRRVRPEGTRGRMAHQPPDRGGEDRDDAQDQARRQGLDQRLPRQA